MSWLFCESKTIVCNVQWQSEKLKKGSEKSLFEKG